MVESRGGVTTPPPPPDARLGWMIQVRCRVMASERLLGRLARDVPLIWGSLLKSEKDVDGVVRGSFRVGRLVLVTSSYLAGGSTIGLSYLW